MKKYFALMLVALFTFAGNVNAQKKVVKKTNTTAVRKSTAGKKSTVAKKTATVKKATATKKAIANKSGDLTYDVVDQMPVYPGGPTALINFLSSHVQYPVEAQEKGIQGKPVISFIIEKDGSISGVEVARSAHPMLDKEAMRVVKLMPKWKPGKQDGKAVRVKYNVAISFSLK